MDKGKRSHRYVIENVAVHPGYLKVNGYLIVCLAM